MGSAESRGEEESWRMTQCPRSADGALLGLAFVHVHDVCSREDFRKHSRIG